MITFLAQVTAYTRHDNALFLVIDCSWCCRGLELALLDEDIVLCSFTDLGVILDKLLLNINGVRV